MDGKYPARIAAAALAGLALAVALVKLREEPEISQGPAPAVWVPDGDPLPAQLRACAEMGELALSSPDCRAAWAEKRRRFFDVEHPEAYSSLDKATPDQSGPVAVVRTTEN